ncbi:MAG: histidine kinase dimerization/phosphoacceptor domain -containing protein, partial [Desulforhopalus sp.]
GVDGKWHPVLARGVPIRDEDGQVVCWAGINLDIANLKQTEKKLQNLLREKEVLLQEVHHRVKNNLQVISSLFSLQADKLAVEGVRSEFDDMCDRIRTMSLIHEKLYKTGDLGQLNFAEYATDLLRSLWRSHSVLAEKVRLNLALSPVELSIELAVPCGLILNELATNALKHAFYDTVDGEVTVGLAHDPNAGTVCLQVADNGSGLPNGINWQETGSLGLHLVQILARQLGGTIDFAEGPGADFSLTFPLKGLPDE